MLHAYSLLMSLTLLGVCGAHLPPPQQEKAQTGEAVKPAIPLNEQEAIIKEVLQSWDRQYNEFETYSFDVAITETDPVFKRDNKGTAKILMMKRPNGNIWIKMDLCNEKGKPTTTYILRDRQFICMNPHSKELSILTMSKPFDKREVANISEWIFSSIPFFQTDEAALRKQYNVSIAQKDEHYTWIKLTPLNSRSMRSISIGQIGIINYSNNLSPRHFPILVMWRDPGNKEINWKFTKVAINHPFTVVDRDFYLDFAQLKTQGWHTTSASMKSSIDLLRKLIKMTVFEAMLNTSKE